MVSPAYDRVIEKLTEVTGYTPQGSATQRSARCPAHEDHRASLSVGLGRDGAVLLHCHTEVCTPEDVWSALGLLARDLFVEPKAPREPDPHWMPCTQDGHKWAAEYLYTDEQGNTLFGAVRCDQKCFRQWRPDPTARTGRRWKLKDDQGNYLVRLVPYRLPQLLQAKQEQRVIWVTEGEKDALAVASRPGGVATCNPMGANSWRDEYDQYFEGADVLICVDNDEAGKRHANTVFIHMQKVANSIQVVLPRYGKDASDHFAAGGWTGDFIKVSEWVRQGGDR